MNPRREVSESTWLGSFAGLDEPAVDYVVVELGDGRPRPWLESARNSVELIGRVEGVLTRELVDRALELDLDFLCLAGEQPELDPKRLPLRLIVENPAADPLATGLLYGAAWARRVCGWEGQDPAGLAELARGERIFLAAGDRMPDPAVVSVIAPFAIGLPDGTRAADLGAWNPS